MTSAPVREAVNGIGAISNVNTAKAERTQSKEHDFSKIMSRVKNNAEQTVHQSDQQLTEKSTAPQPKKTYEERDNFKSDDAAAKLEKKNSNTVNDTSKKARKLSKDEPVSEEVTEAVEETVKEVMQEVEETLEVSEEELLEVLEQLGLQPMDLLNPDNMAAVLTELTGEDSIIQLVMDEDMYLTFQDLMQMVDAKTQELLNSTGLTDEELEVVMDQLKFLIDQKLSEENGIQDVDILSVEQPELVEEAGELEDGEVPVMVKKDAEVNEIQDTKQTPETAQVVEENAEAGKSEDSLFEQQQQNMESFQNTAQEMSELAQEAKLQDSDTPSTESILKQLTDYVKIQNGKELTEMELQLHPASLGNVKVLLSTKGGVVTAQLTTENEIVKNAIESQVSQLKLNLEEQGVKVEAIEIAVASHQMERNLEQNAGDNHNQEQTEESNNIHKIRKTSINLNSYDNEEELIGDITGADDATRIAVEMMAIGGNRMDLLA